MDIVFLLVPLSVVLVFGIAVVFWWSVQSGQFEDLERQGQTVLEDDDAPSGNVDRPLGEASGKAGEGLAQDHVAPRQKAAGNGATDGPRT